MSTHPLEIDERTDTFGLTYNDYANMYREAVKSKKYRNAKEYIVDMLRIDKELASQGEP